MKKIDAQTETRIVALIARGDTYQSIKDQLAKDDIDISTSHIGYIKERNQESLDYIKNSLIQHETTNATRIMGKARQLVEDKLDSAADNDKIRSEALRAFLSHEIEKDEYESILRETSSQIALKDLVTTSKEFFNQSQIESGKPTSITENPAQAKENLKRLLTAINNNDEKEIVKAIFLEE